MENASPHKAENCVIKVFHGYVREMNMRAQHIIANNFNEIQIYTKCVSEREDERVSE